MSLELNHLVMLKERYVGAVQEQESMIASYKQGIVDTQRSISYLKEREPYAVGDGVKKAIADLYVQIGGLETAIANAESKAAEYRTATQGFDSEIAKLNSAAGKISGALREEVDRNSAEM